MYEVFYNLKAEPFRLSPDHKFCFEHKGYAKARAYMAYAFKRAEGFVMITGRPGTGKTTLIGELVESMARDKVFTANLVCTQLQADDLLKTVGYSFGIGSARVDKAELLQRLTILFHRWHREGRRALLIVDEAQDLSPSAMEELRLLTNIQTGGQPLLQIFLLGQPELRDLILSPEMEQVHQRIVAASHIEGLEADETEAYVIHRLTAVGWQGDPAIDRAIFPLIHKFSEGVPRRINLICSRLFLLGSVEQRHAIGVEDVAVVITELQAENLAAGTNFSRHDFNLTQAPDWVPSPVPVGQQAPVEPHLHVVQEEPAPVPVPDSVADTPDPAKKKVSDPLAPGLPGEQAPIAVPEPPIEVEEDYAYPEHEFDAVGPASVVAAELDSDSESDYDWQPPDEPRAAPQPRSRVAVPARPRWWLALVLGVVVALGASVPYMWGRYFGEREIHPLLDFDGTGAQPAPADAITPDPDPVAVAPDELVPASEPAVAAQGLPAAPRGDSAGESARDNGQVQQAGAAGEMGFAEPSGELSGEDQVSGSNEIASTSISAVSDADGATAVSDANEDVAVVFQIRFPFDSDAVVPDSYNALDDAVAMLRDQPELFASITGFTDDAGNENYNLALSRKRADAVAQYLVDAGIARQRLRVEGRGVLLNTSDTGVSAAAQLEPQRIVAIRLGSNVTQ